jgi:anti-anti-sigma factor
MLDLRNPELVTTLDPPPVRVVADAVDLPAYGAAVRLVGRVDARNVAELRDSLHAALDDGVGALGIDVSELAVGDATGLGVLVGTHRHAGRVGRSIVLRNVPPRLQRLLAATRLHRILSIEAPAG